MKNLLLGLVLVLALATTAFGQASATAAGMASGRADTLSYESQRALVGQYCFYCHDDDLKTGGMTLTELDLEHVERSAELAEKVIRKLRGGVMPPLGQPRPDARTIKAFASSLESAIDQAAAAQPNPGRPELQRLNRAEYARSVRDLLGIEVDVDLLLPPDTMGGGFDNMAEALTTSPTLVEGYVRAAGKISREAVGDPKASATSVTYTVARTASQMSRVEGAPFGTRGGVAVTHNFPADGDYIFTMMFYGTATGDLFGLNQERSVKEPPPTAKEHIEISVDGERVALLDINREMHESDPNGLSLRADPIFIKAGPRMVSAAFIERFAGLVDDMIRPIQHTMADQQVATGPGITTLPHLQDLNITGPHSVRGISETPSRRRIFTCRPTAPGEEELCATEIVTKLAGQAYRRPVTAEDLEGLMNFYRVARKEGDFESGIRMALQVILASPSFVFRFEQTPEGARPGQTYRISDTELASRLSYFLWSTLPDDELLTVARRGKLRDPAVLEQQVRRMLEDPRSESLAIRFAGQWLRLQDLKDMHPDPTLYPQFDTTLAQSMRRETELFFDNVVREDRSVLDLLTADYTFVDERLAKHYGFPNVLGNKFRRVETTDENRKGLLGHASILTATSLANRTSPVIRGKWVMEVLLGTPPPPPPPDVPALEEIGATEGGKLLTLRQRLEEHRENPLCASCHEVMDPIGFALENFDPTGRWRTRDTIKLPQGRVAGDPIDAAGELFDGTKLNGPASLRQAIVKHSDVFIRAFTENLLAYGLGRKVEYYDMPTVRAIGQGAALNNNRFSSFILGVVKSPAFQMRKVESAEVAPVKPSAAGPQARVAVR